MTANANAKDGAYNYDRGSIYTISVDKWNKPGCFICGKTKPCVVFSDHIGSDTDEIDFNLCKECIGKALELIKKIT